MRAAMRSARASSPRCGRRPSRTRRSAPRGPAGFVVARTRGRARVPVEVGLGVRPEEGGGAAARVLAAWRGAGGGVGAPAAPADVEALARRLARAAAVVDALFGTGLNAPVAGVAAAVIAAINASGAPVLAVDIASGLSADTGAPLGAAVRATVTATFGYPKVGQLMYPGVEHTGLLAVVDIGIPREALATVAPGTVLLESEEVGAHLPPRRRDAHKGDFGHVLVIAGSRGKTGAALLAAQAAARSGAGLTTLAVPATLQAVLEAQVREAMTAALADTGDGAAALADGAAVNALLADREAVVCGPGLGQAPATRALVAHVVRQCAAPAVLDADGVKPLARSA